ncbi:hypothetical protein D3C73_701780 [compost metagenome]
MLGITKDGDWIAVLACGDVSQRESLANHVFGFWRNRNDALNELVSQPALVERSRNRCRGDFLEFGACRLGKDIVCHDVLKRYQVRQVRNSFLSAKDILMH